MRVSLSRRVPEEWTTKKPLESYETQYIYVGFRRYDKLKRCISSIYKNDDGTIEYHMAPYENSVFARSYSSENVRVNIYSQSPRVWSEELSPHEVFFFVQQPTQAAST
jgi:hypothetical protein